MFEKIKKILFFMAYLALKKLLISDSIEMNNRWILSPATPYDYPFSRAAISDEQPERYFLWDSDNDGDERLEKLEIY